MAEFREMIYLLLAILVAAATITWVWWVCRRTEKQTKEEIERRIRKDKEVE